MKRLIMVKKGTYKNVPNNYYCLMIFFVNVFPLLLTSLTK